MKLSFAGINVHAHSFIIFDEDINQNDEKINQNDETVFVEFFSDNRYIINMTGMSVEQQIFFAIAYRATNISAIARELGMSPQNLHRKISRNTLRKEELCEIGKILGGKYVSYFSFPGGVKIGDTIKSRKGKTGTGRSKAAS